MENEQGPVILHEVPELHRPYLIAAWSGMGAVALLTVNYLRQALDARFFGEIDPYDFYSPVNVSVENGLIQPPAFPETRFYFWDQGQTHDLIFLIGADQPPDAYDMAGLVAETAVQFGVERVYTTAAFPTFIHHNRMPGLWGAVTSPELLPELQEYEVRLMDQGTIGGLNGLLLSVGKEFDLDGICLLGEIPLYATEMINPRASYSILQVLIQMLEVDVPLGNLLQWAQDLESEMDKLYQMLPEQMKEAFTENAAPPAPRAADVDQPLVVDDAFFDEIERFLSQRRDSNQGSDKEDGPGAAAS